MQRAQELQQLSREHNFALALVRDVRWAAAAPEPWLAERAAYELAVGWQKEISRHFDDEDRALRRWLPPELLARLDSDHVELRAQFSALVATVGEQRADPLLAQPLADLLHAHIRWEEQTLYPDLQARLTAEELSLLVELLRPVGG